jgi:hypothetical protein
MHFGGEMASHKYLFPSKAEGYQELPRPRNRPFPVRERYNAVNMREAMANKLFDVT